MIRRHNPENHDPNFYRHGNLKSHILIVCIINVDSYIVIALRGVRISAVTLYRGRMFFVLFCTTSLSIYVTQCRRNWILAGFKCSSFAFWRGILFSLKLYSSCRQWSSGLWRCADCVDLCGSETWRYIMQEICSSETLVIIYKATRCHNPEGHNRHLHCREILKSHVCCP
jgi:hypothetical protein